MSTTTGRITGVNGNMITVFFEAAISLNEVGYACSGDLRLKAEVVRIRGSYADMQVFEDTTGLGIGVVEFTGHLLSARLGPGCSRASMTVCKIRCPTSPRSAGSFLQRGMYLDALDPASRWQFTPVAKPGDRLTAGETLGTVPEGIFTHRIMTPFHSAWRTGGAGGGGGGRTHARYRYGAPSRRVRKCARGAHVAGLAGENPAGGVRRAAAPDRTAGDGRSGASTPSSRWCAAVPIVFRVRSARARRCSSRSPAVTLRWTSSSSPPAVNARARWWRRWWSFRSPATPARAGA